MLKQKIICIFAPLVLTVGCDGGPSEEVSVQDTEEYWKSALVDNGVNLNGVNLNGVNLNGVNLNGVNLNGVNLNGVNLNGVNLNGVNLNSNHNGSLTGVSDNSGVTVSDAQLSGATLTGQLSNNTSLSLRIDSVTFSDTDRVYLYNVSARGDAGWVPLCGTASGKPIPAIPTSGQWDAASGAHIDDPNTFTFACVNAAVGKCITWGYQPWATKQECKGKTCRNQPLDAWLQACTRMVRADYCGDGVSHTRNGTPINVWDSLGIQVREGSAMRFEAEWSQDGAHCIQKTRWVMSQPNSLMTDSAYVQRYCSSRMRSGNNDSCGGSSDFSTEKGLDISVATRHLLRNESSTNL